MKEKIIESIESIRKWPNILYLDEQSTKQGIILKLLFILGWDFFNTEEVKPEYTVGNNRVDYSLRNGEDNKIFIEVKRTREELDTHQSQLLNYSFQEGVPLSILTNGRQ